jgi:hypothetical protein
MRTGVAALANRFLDALAPEEQRRMLDLARVVTAASDRWLTTYPIVRRPSVTAACALVSAVAMPVLDVAELTLLTCWWLWIFGVDDVFDDSTVPDEWATSWADRYQRELPIDHVDGDALLGAIGALHRELRAYPLYPLIGHRWRDGMTAIVRAMLRERQWSAGAAYGRWPSYQEYLDNGIVTIAMRPYTVTACILAGDAAAGERLDALDPMIRAAARCFRLANDLRSDARERAEGKINAVSLLQHDLVGQGADEAAALHTARQLLDRVCTADLAYLDAAHRAAPPERATLARFLWAHTTFVWEMYRTSDYDTLSRLLREESPH